MAAAPAPYAERVAWATARAQRAGRRGVDLARLLGDDDDLE
jgi:hypothetical protein